MNVSRDDIVSGLKAAGLKRGRVVLPHIAMSSFGWVEGGADTVISAFREVIGNDGTLCFAGHSKAGPPWLSKSPAIWKGDEKPLYGRTPKALVKMDGTYRSVHPCVSMAAIGADAKDLVNGHEEVGTPCGLGTPWHKLADKYGNRSKILRIGFHSTTMVDVAMDTVNPDIGLTPRYITKVWLGKSDPDNKMKQIWVNRGFRYCLPARIRDSRFYGINLPRLWESLKKDTVSGLIGECMSYVNNAGQTYQVLREMAKRNR